MNVTLPSGTPAFLAQPSAPTGYGLVVLPDIFGLRPLFGELCTRLADEQGWAVCAVEPFPGQEHLDRDGRFAAVAALDDDLVLGDASAAADLTEAALVGVIGFCMGGMYTFKAAGSGRFHRAVSFYGMIRLPADWTGSGQREPLEYLARPGASPTLAIIGTADPYTPPDDVAALEEIGVSVARYEGCEHGFVHDPERPAHRPREAADAWRRTIEFLRG